MSLTCFSCEHWNDTCTKGHTDELILLRPCPSAEYVPGRDEIEVLGQIQARIEALPTTEARRDALKKIPGVLQEQVKNHLKTVWALKKAHHNSGPS